MINRINSHVLLLARTVYGTFVAGARAQASRAISLSLWIGEKKHDLKKKNIYRESKKKGERKQQKACVSTIKK